MEITAIVNTHGNVKITKDTIDSILHYMTDQVRLVVDEAAWPQFEEEKFECHVLKALYHNFYKAPYKNVILGIATAVQNWPKSNWYCYLEFDCLIGSSKFKKDLKMAEYNNIWCLGNDLRTKQTANLSFAERIVKAKFKEVFYLLGACLFMHNNFMKKALEHDFFSRFLHYTNDFKDSYFPFYTDHDVVEHLLPTLAKHWGGEITQFAKWNDKTGGWHGNYQHYPIRFRPDLYTEDEFVNAWIMHPLKEYNSEIREYHRRKRC